MKKITLVAALLGAAYFSHAQVGIGTPTPADASQLDIVANNKGILIPRVELRTLSNFGPIAGTQIESLLVYNTASITAENIAPGFYYWFESKWERIVNQKQLDETINNITDLQGDVDKIINLLKVAFPSNNLVDPSVDGDTHGGGMVFTPGDATTEPKIEYVYFDGTSYVKKDITSDIINIIRGAESKTTIVEYDGNQYYLSEAYIQNGGETDPANWTSVPSGAILLDVVAGVVNNFEEFVTNNSVTVDGNTYNTIEEYIEYISQNSMQDGVTKIVIDATTNQASFQIWDAATDTWVDVDNSAFKKIVTDNESETTIVKNELGAIADGDLEITYDYFNEKQPDVTGTPQATIDVNADIKNLIEGNIDIQKAITKILNDGGNVYYGDHDNDGATPDVFYTIINDVKTPIDIAEVIVNAIKNATTVQKQEIKNQLGDKINNTTVTKTGDTFNGSDIYIYTNKTTIAANSAETTGIEIPSGTTPDQIIGIKVIGAKGVVASVTDIVVTGQQIDFNIGAGNMYNILGAGNYDVVVEFTAQ